MEQTVERAWIEQHIPHKGSMCLLDQVQAWDEQKIVALSASHFDLGNPLRAHGRLGAAAGIEYAAQAMAVHGALLAASCGDAADGPKAGFLASVRGANLFVERLDDLSEPLRIEATRIHSEGNTILYQFQVTANGSGVILLDGRATVIVDAALAIPFSS